MTGDFFRRGWVKFEPSPEIAAWAAAALPPARAAMADPANAKWWRHGRTWFVGVHALPNDRRGAVPAGPALSGSAVDFVQNELSLANFTWDAAQISACTPGYPQDAGDESSTAHRYRAERDAAHVDGLHREAPDNRRFAREYHAFILGIPLSPVTAETSPFVVWEGSHEIMREAFARALSGVAPEDWAKRDITEAYHAARRKVFAECPRIEITAAPGECYLVHRLALHGMARWRGDDTMAPPRIVVYFRPDCIGPEAWLKNR